MRFPVAVTTKTALQVDSDGGYVRTRCAPIRLREMGLYLRGEAAVVLEFCAVECFVSVNWGHDRLDLFGLAAEVGIMVSLPAGISKRDAERMIASLLAAFAVRTAGDSGRDLDPGIVSELLVLRSLPPALCPVSMVVAQNHQL
jgi:hypothetical protein